MSRPGNKLALNRALSKLRILSRSQATEAIRQGRVTVDGRVVRDPLTPVVAGRTRIAVDGAVEAKRPWRTILFHKPRGVVTTSRDPQGRRTIYDVLGDEGRGLIAAGRLDLATSGLLILTTDTDLANRITDPASGVPRVYVVTVRGEVTADDCARMERGVMSRGERIHATVATLTKASRRESHLTIEMTEGKNREVRRLCDAIGREVTRLKRVRFGGLEIGDLGPGEWRELSRAEIARAFR